MDSATASLIYADQLVDALKLHHNLDYSAVRQELADQIWNDGHWQGNWDVTTDLPEGYRNLRAIEEDEYDQHMDEDDSKPEWDDMATSDPIYVWFA